MEVKTCPSCGVVIETLLHGLLPHGAFLNDGKYQIEYPLGRGGFGVTYRGQHVGLGAVRAIKEFYPQHLCWRDTTSNSLLAPEAQLERYRRCLERFMSEGRTLSVLRHPNIVTVHDLFEENNTAYLVMEFIEGWTLRDELRGKEGGGLEAERVEEIVRALALALEQVHRQNIFHLDIKPENVLVSKRGRIVLTDFGATRVRGEERHRLDSQIQFTEIYAPPEVIAGEDPGPESDLFELAMMTYELLTGELPPSAVQRILHDQKEWEPARLREPWHSMLRAALVLERTARPRSVREWVESFLSEWGAGYRDAMRSSAFSVEPRRIRLNLRDKAKASLRVINSGESSSDICCEGPPWLSVQPSSFRIDPGTDRELRVEVDCSKFPKKEQMTGVVHLRSTGGDEIGVSVSVDNPPVLEVITEEPVILTTAAEAAERS